MQLLLARTADTKWDMLVMLGGIYGLRISEALGLRWGNVDLENGRFNIVEQMDSYHTVRKTAAYHV